MKIRSLLVVFLFVFSLILVRLDAQTFNLNISTDFQLSPEAESFGKDRWAKMLKRVQRGLESGVQKYRPGRLIYKNRNSPLIRLMEFDEKIAVSQALAKVMRDPSVEYSQPDYIYKLLPYELRRLKTDTSLARNYLSLNKPHSSAVSNVPNDPFYALQSHLNYLGMDTVYQRSGFNLGSGAVIHLVDSGGGCNHPDISQGNIISEKDYVDFDDDSCSDKYGNGLNAHGQLVLATMGAIPNNGHGGAGIIPDAKFHIWRVIDASGSGSSFTIDAAILQIANQSDGAGNEVVNLSLAGPYDDPLQDFAVEFARTTKNIIFVASAGNSGKEGLYFPAAIPGVVSVGALEFPLWPSNEKMRASYSSFGSNLSLSAVVGSYPIKDRNLDNQPDGVLVEGPVGEDGKHDMFYFLGTSAAAPLVSGTIGLLLSYGIRNIGNILPILTQTADDILPDGFDKETGAGAVRADAALGSIDGSLPISGYFKSSSYICTVATGQKLCEATISYKINPRGQEFYLYDNYGAGTLIQPQSSEGSSKIKVDLNLRTWALLIHYQGGIRSGSPPQIFGVTQIYGRPAE